MEDAQSLFAAQNHANDFLSRALTIGEQMLYAGAEVSRVEDTIHRICTAYGAERTDVLTITAGIQATVSAPAFGAVTQTRRIVGQRTDFHRLDDLNQLSRTICEKKPPLSYVDGELARIAALPRGSFLGQLGIYAMISASFSLLFGGAFQDALAAALVGMGLKCLAALFGKLEWNPFLTFFLCSLAGGFAACLAVQVGLALSVEKICIGCIMPRIPGLQLTNAIRDLFSGDTISGLLRFMEAVLLTVIMALGFVLAIVLF